MRYLISAFLVTGLALGASAAWPSDTPTDDNAADAAPLTMKQCLALQAAKNDGASRADMKKACQWTTDENAPNNQSSSEKPPRPVDSTPYGETPSAMNPPH
jgi:hypothetical protein